ncbi:MAG TPA: TRAP transporter small permease subunit [Methylomirabilota bacterium]|nr:TRAP transporter small permease subunit [Methylomirabilota bacterium]
MRAIIDAYFRLLQFVLTVLLMLLVIPVTLQIVARYTEFIPRYIWTEEAARFLFIWIILIGATIAVRERTHFDVDILPSPKTPRGQAIGELLVDCAFLVIASVFALYGWGYTVFGYGQTSELTGINMATMHAAFLLAGVTWFVFIAERALSALAVLLGGRRDTR